MLFFKGSLTELRTSEVSNARAEGGSTQETQRAKRMTGGRLFRSFGIVFLVAHGSPEFVFSSAVSNTEVEAKDRDENPRDRRVSVGVTRRNATEGLSHETTYTEGLISLPRISADIGLAPRSNELEPKWRYSAFATIGYNFSTSNVRHALDWAFGTQIKRIALWRFQAKERVYQISPTAVFNGESVRQVGLNYEQRFSKTHRFKSRSTYAMWLKFGAVAATKIADHDLEAQFLMGIAPYAVSALDGQEASRLFGFGPEIKLTAGLTKAFFVDVSAKFSWFERQVSLYAVGLETALGVAF